jgi:hypothetical protein
MLTFLGRRWKLFKFRFRDGVLFASITACEEKNAKSLPDLTRLKADRKGDGAYNDYKREINRKR